MQADRDQAQTEGDMDKYAQLDARLTDLTETKITPMTLIDELVDNFNYRLNIDRMMDDLEAAYNAGDEAQYEYLLDSLNRLYYDQSGSMNDEQQERMEDYILFEPKTNKGNENVPQTVPAQEEVEFDYSEEEW